MAADPNRVKDIFLGAAEQPDQAARGAYLDRACGGDAGLRERVETLLRSHDSAGSFLGAPVAAISPHRGDTVAMDPTGPEQDDELQFLTPSKRADSLGRLGHYEMLQVLGKGAFGIVFRAFDDMLQRVVALKVLAPQIASLSPARKRFVREARSSAQVRHENVVQIYEVGEQPLPHLAMEFIPGETLQKKLDRCGPLEVPETLRIGRQVAEGLAAAHACDLIHRDIKPGNILLEGGSHKAKITDFGLARAADDASISQSGIIAGTPMFMSPEQALGHKIDQRADLFSLGSVLYQMASGRPPFRAPSTLAVLKRVAEEAPRPIPEIIPETPDWLCGIIAKLHAKNPAERFQSAREVADLLGDCEAKLKAKQEVKNVLPAAKRDEGRGTRGGKKWVAAATVLLLPVIALGVTEFAGVTHLFRGQQAKVDTTTLGTETVPVANTGLSATSSAIGPIATPEPPADFREVHGVERAAFDIWLGDMKKAKYVPQTLAAWNAEKGDGRFAAVAIRDPQVIDWDLVYSVGPIADLPPGRLELLSKTGFRPVARAMNLSASAIQTADLWIKYPSTRYYTIFRGNLQLLNTRLAECRANSMRPTYLCVTPAAKGPWSFGHIYSRDDGLKWEVEVQINKANLLKELNDYRAKNWRLDCLAVYGEGVQSQFLVEFVENRENVEWSASLDLSTAEYEQELGNHRKLGMCPRQVSAREFGGTTRYSVIWQRTGGKPRIPAAPVTKQEPQPPTYKNSIGMEFVIVPKGKSWLGGGKDKLGDKEVEIPADFYLGKYEVTQEEWAKVMGENPSAFSRTGAGKDAVKDISDADLKRFPVVNVTWDQCQIFVAKLNEREKEKGWVYRLPTVVEWEYACRGGPMSDKVDSAFDFCFAKPTNTLLPEQANFNKGLNRTCKVGSYEPNRLGLFDMHGNVWEWCEDAEKAVGGVSPRVYLGGSYTDYLEDTRAALGHTKIGESVVRLAQGTSYRFRNLGLRLARIPSGAPSPEVKTPPLAVGAFTDADVQRIAALPAAEQVEEVRKELMRRNPGFDGKVEHRIEGDVVTEFRIVTDQVTDINPIRVFNFLRVLDLSGTQVNFVGNGQLADLSPLIGMNLAGLGRLHLNWTMVGDEGLVHFKDCKKLTFVTLDTTQVSDTGLAYFKDYTDLTYLNLNRLKISDAGLAHFKNCKNLKFLQLGGSPVGDAGLSYFKECEHLTLLGLSKTRVTDAGLAHFKDCKKLANLALMATPVTDAGLAHFKDSKELTRLHIGYTKVTDLSLIKGMPLKELDCPFRPERDAEILRSIKTLEKINGKPADQFWKDVEEQAASAAHDTWLKATALLPLDQHAAVLPAKLKERLPGFEDAMLRTIASLAADRQALMVAAWLRDRNSAFEGEITHKIEGGVLTSLDVPSPLVRDLTPLRALPGLKSFTGRSTLGYDNQAARDTDVLKSLKTLENINGKPVAQFWKDAEARQAEFQEWLQLVSTLTAEQQVAAVVARFKERNPGLDGTARHRIEGGVVTELIFTPVKGQDIVTDLAPIRALPGLTWLNLWGCVGVEDLEPLKALKLTRLILGSLTVNNQVRDLEPLKDMKLTELRIYHCQVQDLEPLKGMPLNTLWLHSTQVRDIEPLKGMPLTSLALDRCTPIKDFTPLKGMALTALFLGRCQFRDMELLKGMPLTALTLADTHVQDLEPLKGMPLKRLVLNRTAVTDLKPLQGMELEEIYLTPKNITQGLDVVRGMKSLNKIGIDYNQAWPAAEFWERYDKGEFTK